VLNVQLKQWMHCLQGEFFLQQDDSQLRSRAAEALGHQGPRAARKEVERAPNLLWVREERDHASPVAAPGLRNRGKLRLPFQTKLSQSLLGFRFSRGGVDRLQVHRHHMQGGKCVN
jgi:hypothetical protein